MEPALYVARDHWLTVGFDQAADTAAAAAAERSGYFLFKRTFDLLISTLVIAGILSWLLPLLAVLIKLDSKGPVFFVQKRIGRSGRPFPCLKLRSMFAGTPADEWPDAGDVADEWPATFDDARITGIGTWLRRTHLDELPQFWNVMTGSMSIIGPRPYMPSDCRRFAEMVPAFLSRQAVRPGITGSSQSKGLHGGAPSDRNVIVERCRWDLYYIRHAGFQLDMQILGETLLLLLRGQGSRLLGKVR